ncbi:hypothetical protein PAECIP111892_05313 [Paenibacillus auburnensis]|uniref:Uncharacterized protein n=1 Tax=Paenibacillus auburnensis TaxID=2905649 RepID=A0ABN8H4J5_9BACL|nr:hypothetical protein PAECIP111892_05313 [Paenibacillus auburnensis]
MYCKGFIRLNNSIYTLEKDYFPWEIVFHSFPRLES